jgi:RNA polymerase sigma-70 factor (ECF subfamily)
MILAASMNPDIFSATNDSIARLRRGDLDALSSLMAPYQHRLYRFLVRLTQDEAAAEDLFQQTWLRVVERIGRYDGRRPFDPWLFSVARNLAIDHLRQRRSSSLDQPDDSGVAPVERLVARELDPLEQVLEFERGVVLAAAVADLPLIHREVLALRFEEDMKLEEIAEVVGVPVHCEEPVVACAGKSAWEVAVVMNEHESVRARGAGLGRSPQSAGTAAC